MSDDLRANPYVGIRPFFIEDTLYFFGREEQTTAILDILRKERFVGVVGSSGSGKSSLVRAGVLPSLLGGFLVQDRDRWRLATIKPGDNPMGNLAEGLLYAMGEEVSQKAAAALLQEMQDSHADAVVQYLASRLESNANLFLLVDQFEEIFAFRGVQDDDELKALDFEKRKDRARRKAEAADFVDLILVLSARKELPVYVVLTMRTDFLGDCDVFYSLPEALNRGRYLVPRMSREQLREAVECPARLLGKKVGPRLLDHVLNQLGDRFDRLPMLQHALMRTWDEYWRAGAVGPVDLQHYEAAGGLERALNQDAENALSGLSIETVAQLFRRLTGTDANLRRVRTPARISELQAATGAKRIEIEEILHRFSDNGRNFVHKSADGKPDDPRVDISHESMIRQWDSLRGWLDEEQQARDTYRELVRMARRWERNDASLLRDPELQMYIEWKKKSNLSAGWSERYATGEDEFRIAIDYLSKSADQRRRRTILMALATLIILVTVGFAIRASMLEKESEQKKAEAEQQRDTAETKKTVALEAIEHLESCARQLKYSLGLEVSAKDEKNAKARQNLLNFAHSAKEAAYRNLAEAERSLGKLAVVSAGGSVLAVDSVSLDDLFDVSRGLKITGSSAKTLVSSPPAMFGGTKPNPPSLGMQPPGEGKPELAATMFDDDKPEGFVHWVSWQLPQKETIKSVALFARAEAESGEEHLFSEFRLLRKGEDGQWEKDPLLIFRPALPYGEGEEGNLLSACLPISSERLKPSREFKAEFDAGQPEVGPRIVALDGYADSKCGRAK